MFSLVLFLLISFSSYAQETMPSIKEYCLKEISSLTNFSKDKPKIAGDAEDSSIYETIFMNESNSYCSCVEKSFDKEAKIFNVSSYFLDANIKFSKEDYCRHEHYQEGTFEVSTMISYAKLKEIIRERIKDRYTKEIWLVASQSSLEQRFSCIESNIHNKCFRTGSISVSYQCIINTMSDGVSMNQVENNCPQFKVNDLLPKTVEI